jgi:Anti-sigma-K factor rskA
VKRQNPSDPRSYELLAERALRPLDAAEQAELRALGAEDDASFDLAAAAIALAASSAAEPLPAELARKILAASPARVALAAPTPISRARDTGSASKSWPAWLAAAAAMFLAGAGWTWGVSQRAKTEVVMVPTPPSAPSTPPAPLTPREEREAFLAKVKDAAKLDWHGTKDPAGQGATGDVVWSASEQRGYMRFAGLEPNDPTKAQYQLWIFDKDRDARYPVDGGIFDVSSKGEVVVAVSARLHVDTPTLFAVTVEKPGGVVVSKRERIVVTAALPPG